MTQKQKISIVWFRQDLRLSDNPAFYYARHNDHPVLPIYILEDQDAGDKKMGAASRVYRHYSLKSLNESLEGHLAYFADTAKTVFEHLLDMYDVQSVFWNRCYEPWRMERDSDLKQWLSEDRSITTESYAASLIWEPWTIKNGSGDPYKVFTPFFKKGCLELGVPRDCAPRPRDIQYAPPPENGLTLDDLNLVPDKGWVNHITDHWSFGEHNAHRQLAEFLDGAVKTYKDDRNIPGIKGTSRLSAALHHGEISPLQMWEATEEKQAAGDIPEKHAHHFKSEICWREFSYHLLYHFTDRLTDKNLNAQFDDFPWDDPEDNDEALKKWQRGQTGYPIIDAAMRELWQTGWMHNRTRMIVGSFLVKDLHYHWKIGERWFWDCLIDADLANNTASWQWVAGSGADAAPYFRVFNPILQSKKFDPEGNYIRKYVPELKNLPDGDLHAPWEASDDSLQKAGITLGETYPKPMVDHATERNVALEKYEEIKKSKAA